MAKNDFKIGNNYLPKAPFDGIEALEKEFLEGLKEDKDVYAKIQEMGLTGKEVKANLALLTSYQEDYNICKKCPGVDACPKAAQHYCIVVKKNGEFLDREYTLCDKYAAILAREARYVKADFKEEWKEKDLRNVDMTNKRNPLLRKLLSIVAKNEKQWIYLTGDYGSGRSYIMACFANSYADSGKGPIAFCDSATLLNGLRDASVNNKERFARDLDTLKNVPLLILDGFGNEYKSDFAFSTVLFPLLSARANNDLPTMFTSDFTMKEIQQMYGEKVAPARGRQLMQLIKMKTGGETVLEGLNVY